MIRPLAMILGFSLLIVFAVSGFAQSMPLGTVRVVNQHATCPNVGVPGPARCIQIQVSCPGTDNLQAVVAVTQPPGTAVGTIVLHGGQGGTIVFWGDYFNKKFANFPVAYLKHGFRVVQIAWSSEWEQTGADQAGSVLNAACRPATFFSWVYNTYDTDKTEPYCLQGHSGGSVAVGYALAHYGLKNEVDAAMVSAGPAIDDMYRGCVDPYASTIAVCPGTTSIYTFPPHKAVDRWEHTTTCQDNPSTSDIAVWSATSLDNSAADYDYPQTMVSGFECPNYNETPGQGMFFFNNLPPASISALKCAGQCNSEEYWYNSAHFDTMVNQMLTDCVLRH